jgi:c-di-GMP-binding flagellar brake protein YcgR
VSEPLAGQDRRQQERRALRGAATVVLSPTQAFEVRTVDVSLGGMAIIALANPRPGTAFSIRFNLPAKSGAAVAIETRALVLHSVLASDGQGFKIGLRFVGPSDATSREIRRYLD